MLLDFSDVFSVDTDGLKLLLVLQAEAFEIFADAFMADREKKRERERAFAVSGVKRETWGLCNGEFKTLTLEY